MSEPKLGEFCWNELITSDTEAGKNFYSELFGWKIQEMDMGDFVYTMFNDPNAPEGPEGMVAGMMKAPMPEISPHWLSYVLVDDVEASAKKAVSLGAEICKEPTELPMGWFAVLKDPQGAVFALWKKKDC